MRYTVCLACLVLILCGCFAPTPDPATSEITTTIVVYHQIDGTINPDALYSAIRAAGRAEGAVIVEFWTRDRWIICTRRVARADSSIVWKEYMEILSGERKGSVTLRRRGGDKP